MKYAVEIGSSAKNGRTCTGNDLGNKHTEINKS
jgi:hypothetical protein